MKKIITVCLSIMMLFTCFVKEIRAENDNSISIISKEKISYNMVTITRTDVEVNGVRFYSLSDSSNIYVYDSNDVLLATAQCINMNNDVLFADEIANETRGQNDIADQYDRWLSWYNAHTYQVKITTVISTVLDLYDILSVVFSSHASEFINFMNLLMSFSSIIYNYVLDNPTFIASAQFSYNQYCNILRKERFAMGSTSGNQDVHWLDTPWIYNVVPEACRFLTNKYPY